MKYLLLLSFLIATSVGALAQKEEVCYNPNLVKDTTKRSIKSVAAGKVGGAAFTINYHSPGVRKRVIWGGLVPYEEVWVTGAHDATQLITEKDIRINGVVIPAGTYALFTIPGQKEWTFIINKHYKQHLASEYDEADDVVRVKVNPAKVDHLERLQYFIEPAKANKGNLSVAWEKVKLTVPFEVL